MPRAVPQSWMPKCKMQRIIFHWTAGTNTATEFDRKHYHILINGDGKLVRGIPVISGNSTPQKGKKASHTLNCNTGSIGVSLCGMGDSQEQPFRAGTWPITSAQWDALALTLADLCDAYSISVTRKTVLSHAEVQSNLGIKQRQKWDISQLPWDPAVTRGLSPMHVRANACGDQMRQMVKDALAGKSVEEPDEDDGGEPDEPIPTDLQGTTALPTTAPKTQEGTIAPPPNGDPDVFWTQTQLSNMGYPPGRIDWLWGGKTAGAIAAFMNDVPETPDFAAPLSDTDFKAVFPQLKPLIEKYAASGYRRPIAVERANATAKDLPGNNTIKQTWWGRLTGKAATIAGGGTVGVGLLDEATGATQGPLDFAKRNMPTLLTKWWFWASLLCIAGAAVWVASRKAEQATINAYREGRLD